MGFRGELTSDSNSPPLETPNGLFFAKTQFQLASFLAAQFLLVVSRPIRFQENEPHIRVHRPRKPIVTCHLFYHGVLRSSSPILQNAAILLVRYIVQPFTGGKSIFLVKK
jgi:hypothetical protein